MMKKLLLFLILVAVGFGAWVMWGKFKYQTTSKIQPVAGEKAERKVILRFALVSDSENENGLLEKALGQAEGMGVNFVIGLGDWSSVGTKKELEDAKKVFESSKLKYFLTAGDHDLWDSRDKQSLQSSTSSAGLKGEDALTNFNEVFGKSSVVFDREKILFVIVDNSDIYRGISEEDWNLVRGSTLSKAQGTTSNLNPRLTFVFAHKTPFHPQSSHVMGEQSQQVADQAKEFLDLLEKNKVDGFFCGDLHFFAQFKSPGDIVKITTVGAVSGARNFQGPRFAQVTVYDDYSWNVEDVEIR